jgi:hypothetical protein
LIYQTDPMVLEYEQLNHHNITINFVLLNIVL